jgi:hypothetical protein
MKRRSMRRTLEGLRSSADGKATAEQFLIEAGCEIHGMYIALPDQGIKPTMNVTAAFNFLTEDCGYKTCDIRKDNPVEV